MSFDVVMKWPGMMGFTVLTFKQPTSPIKKCMTQGIDLVHGWGDVLKIYDVTFAYCVYREVTARDKQINME